jgi:glycosyltransferase involved in cell wall biosynthesis
MRIATLGNAGVIHTRRWVEYFRARGHEVRVWSLEPAAAGFAAEPLPVAPLPGFMRYPLAVPALAQALDRFAPDLIDAHYVPNYGLIGALLGRHPLVVTAWGSDLLVAAARNPLQRARARFVLDRADLVLADANNLGAAARAITARPERVQVVPWGVDLERFRDRGTRQPGLLLSTRMHEPVYDLPTLFEGVRPVLERMPAARLVIAGDGTQRGGLEELAGRILPAGRYTFTGRLDPEALAGWLAQAEVYLSASRSDSTSLSLLEAMAAGTLPVVSDIPGNREWVGEGEGEGARLFTAGDPAALTGALERALGDAAWSAAARTRNRREVEARANGPANMARIEVLFESLRRPVPGRGAP